MKWIEESFESEPVIRPELTYYQITSQYSIGGKNIFAKLHLSVIMILRMAHQRSERWINPRESPSKENSWQDKTHLS